MPFQSFTSFPFLTTIPTQPSPIDLAIGESHQPHDEAMLTSSYTSSIMTTIQTHICHDRTNGMFIYVCCIDQNCGYALGYEFSRIPHLRSSDTYHISLGICKIASKSSSFHPLIFIPICTSHNHTNYSFQSLASNSPRYKFYTTKCTYMYMHPSCCIRKFKGTAPRYFSFISAVDTNHISLEASHKNKEPDPNVATHP